MPTFKNVKQLQAYLKKITKDSMNDVGKHVEHKVREQIDKDVYNAYLSPSVYERTYELKNSIGHSHAKEVGSEIVTEIEHNASLISSEYPNRHMSVIDGSSSVESIAEIVHDGKSGKIFGEGKWTEKREYFSNTRDNLKKDKSHIDVFKKSLKSKGVQIEK